jgi:hypothetical protein
MWASVGRLVASIGMFAISMLVMTFVCVWAWDTFVNGQLYYCTDGGSMDFMFAGDWVHHPESVAHVVPRPMEKPDEIKTGWSVNGLWELWGGFVAVSVLLSVLFAGVVWRASSSHAAHPAARRFKR